MSTSDDIDSKFRYVILASKRAKQLLKGAKPKLKSKSKNLIRIAQEEVDRGMVDYEIIQSRPEDLQNIEDDIFIGEELGFEQEIPEKKETSEKANLIEEIQDQIHKHEEGGEEEEEEEEQEEEQEEEEADTADENEDTEDDVDLKENHD